MAFYPNMPADFDSTYFQVSGGKVSIKPSGIAAASGAIGNLNGLGTNVSLYGTVNLPGVLSSGKGIPFLSAGSMQAIANLEGWLHNDGSGNFVWSDPSSTIVNNTYVTNVNVDQINSLSNTFITVNNNLVIKSGKNISGGLSGGTNLAIVSTIDIPVGAWSTNNCGNGADVTPASMVTLTNSGDTAVFTVSSTTTNELRTRFSLPVDWDGGTVQIHTFWACSGTNSASASKTNFVVSYAAAAVGPGDRLDNLTFGTPVAWTNNCNPFPYEQGTEGVTSALTVGNSPTARKGIVWRIQVLGNASGSTETNSSLYLAQFTVELKRNTWNAFTTPQ